MDAQWMAGAEAARATAAALANRPPMARQVDGHVCARCAQALPPAETSSWEVGVHIKAYEDGSDEALHVACLSEIEREQIIRDDWGLAVEYGLIEDEPDHNDGAA